MRRCFTLIELLGASMMAVIVLGGITTSLSQLGSAKSISRQRLEAFSRCAAGSLRKSKTVRSLQRYRSGTDLFITYS